MMNISSPIGYLVAVEGPFAQLMLNIDLGSAIRILGSMRVDKITARSTSLNTKH